MNIENNNAVTVTLPEVKVGQSFAIKNKGNQEITLSNTFFYEIKHDNKGIHVKPKTGINLVLAYIVKWLSNDNKR